MSIYDEMLRDWDNPPDLEFGEADKDGSRAHIIHDYNLDSALLPDLHDQVRKMLRNNLQSTKMNPNLMRLKLIADANWDDLKPIEEFPRLLPILMKESDHESPFNSYYNWDVNELFATNKTVIDEFLALKKIPCQMVNIDMNQLNKIPLITQIKDSFLLLNYITEVMNSSTSDERDELSRRIEKDYWIDSEDRSERGREDYFFLSFHCKWGRISVISGWCYLHAHDQLLTRPMVLMLKDTIVARYDSACALYMMRFLKGAPLLEVERLLSFYQAGDKILTKYGNAAYDVLKMVEGKCTTRFIDLAAAHRPKVIPDDTFKNYLNGEIDRLNDPEANIFFNIISDEEDTEMVGVYYSCYRHWGHPIVDCDAGLKKLHGLVHDKLEVDDDLAQELGSDLAEAILTEKFRKTGKWYVEVESCPYELRSRNRRFFYCLTHNLKITPSAKSNFGKNWHRLEVIPIFDIPDHVDPSVIYDDKGHSVNRKEFLQVLRTRRGPTSQRVLSRALKEEVPNVGEFLREVDRNGLNDDDLIIGLKAKERELKILARFFSLMTWNLRLYFVLTEYLIKRDILPHFPELTMADSGIRTIEKMLGAMEGHGCVDESLITYTNGIDYKKWNNMQREESSKHVFEVMGKFYGLPDLFTRTHEFFRRSWVYYNGKVDQITVGPDGIPTSPGGKFYFWTGQLGGFEGLRQKGWTVLSALILRRTLDTNITRSVVLAQGDNQIISLKFKLDTGLPDHDLRNELRNVRNKNERIMKFIFDDIRRLGMEINHDETVTSTDVLIYGKKIFVRGCRVPLYCKIFSRATCGSNDQLPSLPTLISSVVTMSLTAAQESDVASMAMYLYVYFAIFTATNLITHNILARKSFVFEYKAKTQKQLHLFWLNLLFLDPALGGSGGASLSRFMVRGFPDPVSESLSFYKAMTKTNIPEEWKKIFISFGYPKMGSTIDCMRKLLENPLSINISRPANAVNIVKDKIKEAILKSTNRITNPTLKALFDSYYAHERSLIGFLFSIKPCFPRFNSEFFAATHVGVADSMMSLFQNSRTLRTCFGSLLGKDIHEKLFNVEKSVLDPPTLRCSKNVWECSATRADDLRSWWGIAIVGVTIPHPLEHLGISMHEVSLCSYDRESNPFVNVSVCSYIDRKHTSPGPMDPYMGSSTSEGAKNFNNWERTTHEPIVKRAANIRRAMGWLFPSDSKISKAILKNLESLTGEKDWGNGLGIYYRSGNPFHRFNSSRQACGGFSSINPNYPKYLSVSSDPLDVGSRNYDFMFQSSLIYAQYLSSEFLYYTPVHTGNHHYHTECPKCLRLLSECNLTTTMDYTFPDKWELIKKMGYNPGKDVQREAPDPPEEVRDLQGMSDKTFSKIVSYAIGHFLSVSIFRGDDLEEADDICTPSLQGKVLPAEFIKHFFEGVYNGGLYNCIIQNQFVNSHRMRAQVLDAYWMLLEQVVEHPALKRLLNHHTFQSHLLTNNLSSTSRYPDNLESLSLSLLREARRDLTFVMDCHQRRLLIPSDWSIIKNQAIGICVTRARSLLSSSNDYDEGKIKEQWKPNKQIMTMYLTEDPELNITSSSDLAQGFKNPIIVSICDMRTMAKARQPIQVPDKKPLTWKPECDLGHEVLDASAPGERREIPPDFPDHSDSLIRGLRIPRLSTGAYLKLIPILNMLPINPKLSLCLADGSGGFCSYVLRRFKNTRCYFNSLLEARGNELAGRQAGPPSALQCLSPDDVERCDNYLTCWQDQGDLRLLSTWTKIRSHIELSNHAVGLVTVDLNKDKDNTILQFLLDEPTIWTHPEVLLVFKTFVPSCFSSEHNVLDLLNRYFFNVQLSFPEAQSYGTKEVYALCQSRRKNVLNSFTTSDDVLRDIKKKCRALNLDKERPRITKLLKANQFKGVPPEIHPNPTDILLAVLGQFNMTPTVQNAFLGLLESLPTDSIGLRLDLIEAVCICSYIPLHRSYNDSWPGVSDNDLVKINSLRLGIQLYLYAREGGFDNIEQMAKKADFCIKFLFKIYGDPGVITYRFVEKKGLDRRKEIKKSRDIPFESFVIRAMHSAFGDMIHYPNMTIGPVARYNLDKRLKLLNFAWDVQHIFNHTGLLGNYCKRSRFCKDCRVAAITRAKAAEEK